MKHLLAILAIGILVTGCHHGDSDQKTTSQNEQQDNMKQTAKQNRSQSDY